MKFTDRPWASQRSSLPRETRDQNIQTLQHYSNAPTHHSCVWSLRGRGPVRVQRRLCGVGWRRGWGARSCAPSPASPRRCSPEGWPWRESPWQGQVATPCLPVEGSRFVAFCLSGRGCWEHTQPAPCQWCSVQSLRDIPAWCPFEVWPVVVKPTSVSLLLFRSVE